MPPIVNVIPMSLIVTTEKRAVPYNSGGKKSSIHCGFMMHCVCMCAKQQDPLISIQKSRQKIQIMLA